MYQTSFKRNGWAILMLATLLTIVGQPAAMRAADKVKHTPAGKLKTAKGTLLRRDAPEAKWQVVYPKATIPTNVLLVGLPGAVVESRDRAVDMHFQTDFNSPLPVLECAATLNQTKGFDLDVTLDRGRLDLVNVKRSGAAKVRLRARGENFDLTLEAPGASVAVELSGRWDNGSRFVKTPGPMDVPRANLIFLVLKGQTLLHYTTHEHRLAAPPGAALIGWDNQNGLDHKPQHLDKPPDWSDGRGTQRTEEDKAKYKKGVERLQQLAVEKSVDASVQEMLESDEPIERRLGVILTGALDELPRLGPYLRQQKYADMWDPAIEVLHHWMGRCPGQDQKLYQALIEKVGYTKVQAETLLQLLHGFNDEELAQPETYELLIAYLGDERPGVRALAHWHLIRLVPSGRDIAYDPLASKEARERARAEWQKLIPAGKMPAKTNGAPK